VKFRIYCIFRNPLDYQPKQRSRRRRRPEHREDNYVVRGGTSIKGEWVPDAEPLAVVHDLEAARAAVPAGLTMLARNPQDVRSLVETWL